MVGQAFLFSARLQRLGNRLVRVQRFLAAAQDDRVAGLDAEDRRVRRHVGTRFIDDRDDPDGDAHFDDFEPIGAKPFADLLADGVLQADDIANAFDHAVNPAVGQQQAIQHRAGNPRRLRRFHVPRIGFLERRAPGIQFGRHGFEDAVLAPGRKLRQLARRPHRPIPHRHHLIMKIHRFTCIARETR